MTARPVGSYRASRRNRARKLKLIWRELVVLAIGHKKGADDNTWTVDQAWIEVPE